MMKNFQHLLLVLLVILLATSCEKEITKYVDDPRINFFERTNDQNQNPILSKSFSFIAKDETVLTDTVLIRAKIMGLTATVDRKFSAIAIAGLTNAIAGTDYKILDGTIKAGALLGYLPVVLYRTAELKTVSKVLVLQTADAGDFKTGVSDENTFTLSWNDSLIKPANWDTLPGLSAYFGIYSLVKYEFIVRILGMSDFPIQTDNTYNPDLLSPSQMLDLKAKLKSALGSYNSTNPPLTDEFGLAVTFP